MTVCIDTRDIHISKAYLSRARQTPSDVFRCKEVSTFSHDSRFSGSACYASSRRNGVSGNEDMLLTALIDSFPHAVDAVESKRTEARLVLRQFIPGWPRKLNSQSPSYASFRGDLLRRQSVDIFWRQYSSCLCLILRPSPCGAGTEYACACPIGCECKHIDNC